MPFSPSDYDRFNKLLFAGVETVAQETDKILVGRRLWRNHHKVLEALNRLGPMGSLNELANAIDVSKQALNGTLRGVVKQQLVRIDDDPNNRRVKRIEITDEGAELVKLLADEQFRFYKIVCDKVGRDAMEKWSDVMVEIRDADPDRASE